MPHRKRRSDADLIEQGREGLLTGRASWAVPNVKLHHLLADGDRADDVIVGRRADSAPRHLGWNVFRVGTRPRLQARRFANLTLFLRAFVVPAREIALEALRTFWGDQQHLVRGAVLPLHVFVAFALKVEGLDVAGGCWKGDRTNSANTNTGCARRRV